MKQRLGLGVFILDRGLRNSFSTEFVGTFNWDGLRDYEAIS